MISRAAPRKDSNLHINGCVKFCGPIDLTLALDIYRWNNSTLKNKILVSTRKFWNSNNLKILEPIRDIITVKGDFSYNLNQSHSIMPRVIIHVMKFCGPIDLTLALDIYRWNNSTLKNKILVSTRKFWNSNNLKILEPIRDIITVKGDFSYNLKQSHSIMPRVVCGRKGHKWNI